MLVQQNPRQSIGQWVVCAIPAKLQKSMGQWADVPANFLEPGGCWTSNPAGHWVGPGVGHITQQFWSPHRLQPTSRRRTSEHPVPPCTPPCSQRLASPQPITSHLHTTSFISASSISASSHCSAVLATTSTLTAIGLAVGASEAPVPPSAHSTHRPLPLPLHTSHSPRCTAHRSCPPHLHCHTREPPCLRNFSYPQLSPPHHHPFVAASS